MGMDFIMVVGHKMTPKEIINFPNLSLWNQIDLFLEKELNYNPNEKYRKWSISPTEKMLQEYWKSWINDEVYEEIEIDCYFGRINIYERTLTLKFYTIWWSYKFFNHAKDTKEIIKFGRLMAEYLGTKEILYIPDGYIKTSILEDSITNGLPLKNVIKKGIEKFGSPPSAISKGRKNYFFVDNVDEPIGEIKEWDEEENFWEWNDELGEAVQIKVNNH